MRGRRIYGEVIPWNAVWRTGSNAATTLVVDKDMVIGGTRIPAGRYTLFSTLSPGEWTLIINKRTGEWGTDYDPTADLARIPMQVSSGTDRAERFTITIEPTSARSTSSAMLSLSWDTVVARVPIRLAAPST